MQQDFWILLWLDQTAMKSFNDECDTKMLEELRESKRYTYSLNNTYVINSAPISIHDF